MTGEIVGDTRRPLLGKVGGRANHGRLQRSHHPDGNHVGRQQVLRSNSGVEALGHDIDGRSRSSKRSPASVSETLRVVRFSKRTLRRSSSWRIEWLSADGVTPSRNAAARKLSSSATAMNAVRSARSPRWDIPEFPSTPNASDMGFSFAAFINIFGSRLVKRGLCAEERRTDSGGDDAIAR